MSIVFDLQINLIYKVKLKISKLFNISIKGISKKLNPLLKLKIPMLKITLLQNKISVL